MYSFYKPCGIHLFYFAFLFLISSLLLCCLFSAKHSLNCGQLNERGYNKFLVTKNMFALCVCVCVSRRVLAAAVVVFLGLVLVSMPLLSTGPIKPAEWVINPAHRKVRAQ